MSDDCKWKPDFDKWYNVNKEAYKFTFEQAVIKLDDLLTESESITNKSIKWVTGIIAIFGFFVGFLIQKKLPIGYNSVFIIFFIIDVAGLLFLIFPKEIKGRGFVPSELLPEKLDNPDDEKYQQELLYYFAIVKIEEDISVMRKKNSFRANIYLASIILGLLLLVSGATYIVALL